MRQPSWDVDRVRGEEAEKLWRRLRSQIASGDAEVKCDDRSHDTGNIYVEYECLRGGEWRPSGIAETKAEVWVFYFGATLVIVPTFVLKDIVRAAWRNESNRKQQRDGSHPTKGVVLKRRDLLEAAERVWHGKFVEQTPAAPPQLSARCPHCNGPMTELNDGTMVCDYGYFWNGGTCTPSAASFEVPPVGKPGWADVESAA